MARKKIPGCVTLLSLSLLNSAASSQTTPVNVLSDMLPTTTSASLTAQTPVDQSPAATSSGTSQPSASSIKKNSLSFNFQDVSIKTLLQIIAKNSGTNFVISDSVKGNMSLSLQNVTWEKALNVVLRANGLDSRQYDNVLIIAPVEELAVNDLKRLQSKQQLAQLAQPISVTIPIKFANANDLMAVIKSQQSSLLTANGQIGVDPRTNILWIRDTPESVDKVKTMIQQLDVPAKQVLIEARIVTIDSAYAKELGARWGISNNRNLSGTLEGASEIRNGTSMTAVPVAERLNFNMPAKSSGVFGAQPASAGLALLHLGPGYLDLELSALEGEQHGQVISNPRIITSNLQKAMIQTGTEIPYQEATSSGATSVTFKNAVLSLSITPQITSNNNVVLNLDVTQNKRGDDVQTSATSTVPAIDTQEVQSYVQLKDQETIVIGGVYKQTRNATMQRIPFLSSLPVVGPLFTYKHEDNERSELLIFITPKILTPDNLGDLTPNEKKTNRLSLEVDKGPTSLRPLDVSAEDKHPKSESS